MRYYPQRADRLSLRVKRHQQRFDDRRIDRHTVIEVPLRIREQERGVAVEHDPGRTRLTQHMAPYIRRELPGDRVPSEYFRRATRLEDADSGRVGTAQVERGFRHFL